MMPNETPGERAVSDGPCEPTLFLLQRTKVHSQNADILQDLW